MPKKTTCTKVPANVCSSQLVASTIGLEKTCEGKQAILPRLLVELRKDVMAGRMAPGTADMLLKARMRGVESTCRLQRARAKKAEEIAREAAKKLEAEREAIVSQQAMDGLGRYHHRRRGMRGLFGF
jgi:hypothetical protein